MGYTLLKYNHSICQVISNIVDTEMLCMLGPWEKQPASNQVWVFGLTNFPLSTTKVLMLLAMFA